MAITKWDPFTDLASLRDQLEVLWPFPVVGSSRQGTFVPAVDIYDNPDAIVLEAELAGMKPEDIEIEINDDVLTIKGERKHEEKTEKGGYHRVERHYGSFERRIPLPSGTKAEGIEATCQDGVLTVRVPKLEAKPAERITVKATSAGEKAEAPSPEGKAA